MGFIEDRYDGVIFGLIIAGLSLILYGVKFEVPLATSFGGGIFGASIGLFFGRMCNKDLYKQIIDLYKKDNQAKFFSDDTKLESLRRIWYVYHVTQFEDEGGWYWVQEIYDFRKNFFYGNLITTMFVKNPKTQIENEYDIDAGIRENQIIAVVSRKGVAMGAEPCSVIVFPLAAIENLDPTLGIALMHTWTPARAVSPLILSWTPLSTSEYTINDTDAKKLDSIYEGLISKYYGTSFLPRIDIKSTFYKSPIK